MADGVGLEPTRSLHRDGLATRSFTTQATIHFKLEAGPGIAPGTRAYETLEILFLHPASNFGGGYRIRTDHP